MMRSLILTCWNNLCCAVGKLIICQMSLKVCVFFFVCIAVAYGLLSLCGVEKKYEVYIKDFSDDERQIQAYFKGVADKWAEPQNGSKSSIDK